jgi:hypothetical protein
MLRNAATSVTVNRSISDNRLVIAYDDDEGDRGQAGEDVEI